MLVGYCVRRAGDPGPDPSLAGVGGAPVRLVESAGLGLWISDQRLPDRPGDDRGAGRLREHDAVVRAALETATPLPLRFGTRLRDEGAAEALLAERAAEFAAALERVAGRVEMGIRVLWERPDPPAAGAAVHSGTEFLEMRRRAILGEDERRREAEALLDEVERHLAPLGVPAVREVLARSDAAGTLAHLVQRTRLTRYRRQVDEAGRALPRARLRLSGPWAPYSFARPPTTEPAHD